MLEKGGKDDVSGRDEMVSCGVVEAFDESASQADGDCDQLGDVFESDQAKLFVRAERVYEVILLVELFEERLL